MSVSRIQRYIRSARRYLTSADYRAYRKIVRSLPLKSPIFLPSDKLPLDQAVRGLERVKAIYAQRLDAVYRPRLAALKERYANAPRCFVIGNGPSLNQMDLSLLKDEITFGVNGFFLKARELEWTPTFYVVEDHLVAEDRAEEIEAFKGPTKLFPASLAYCLEEGEDTIFFDHRPRLRYPDAFDFSTDAGATTYAGCTVTFTCLQLAFYMGFREIYLIGVDADYVIPSDTVANVKDGVGVLDMDSEDPNHFDPSYFGRGYRWHDPQVAKMIAAYEEANRTVAGTRTRILNAGIGGKLEVFPRVDYYSLFDHTQRGHPGS